MTTHPPGSHTRDIESETTYEIVIKGHLSDRLGSVFEDVDLRAQNGHTVLTGDFTDQAQLHGVLERIRDFGIELVSVNALD